MKTTTSHRLIKAATESQSEQVSRATRRIHTEPFLLPGGERGCLLVHGFTGDPTETRALGEYLAAQGHTVLGVCLAGHAGTPEDISHVSWRDWLASVEAGFERLRPVCSHITVIGFSLGGALTLLLAQRRRFEQMVLLATPLYLSGDWRLNLLPVVRYVVPWYYPYQAGIMTDPGVEARLRLYRPDADPHDPQVQAYLHNNVRISVAGIYQVTRTLARARRLLPGVTLPALIMQGCDDQNIPIDSASELYARLGTPPNHKTLVWWKETGHHLIITGPRLEAIFARIAAFVAEPTPAR